ncbi:hypothetical protein AB0D38_13945, partial [Streptomyces sp. NPDC048279]
MAVRRRAGQRAVYCLHLHHLSNGEDDHTDWWQQQTDAIAAPVPTNDTLEARSVVATVLAEGLTYDRRHRCGCSRLPSFRPRT